MKYGKNHEIKKREIIFRDSIQNSFSTGMNINSTIKHAYTCAPVQSYLPETIPSVGATMRLNGHLCASLRPKFTPALSLARILSLNRSSLKKNPELWGKSKL